MQQTTHNPWIVGVELKARLLSHQHGLSVQQERVTKRAVLEPALLPLAGQASSKEFPMKCFSNYSKLFLQTFSWEESLKLEPKRRPKFRQCLKKKIKKNKDGLHASWLLLSGQTVHFKLMDFKELYSNMTSLCH